VPVKIVNLPGKIDDLIVTGALDIETLAELIG
jgi:hypothetical protein